MRVEEGRVAQRADARRNRQRVLEAAGEAFATDGAAVPLDEIARRAGVGAGTVYRHFPNKEALYEAVVLGRLEELVEAARDLACAVDPGVAFFDFARRLVHEGGVKQDLLEALGGLGVEPPIDGSPVSRRLRDVLAQLLRRAQAAGAVRDDVGVPEILSLLTGAAQAYRRAPDAGMVADRVLRVVCDGLRPTATA